MIIYTFNISNIVTINYNTRYSHNNCYTIFCKVTQKFYIYNYF